ncbi:hypothetical protein KBC86_01585, partial [Candidatus Gracilibacteria bacterium]|nr:hypothetical protein [Candidatus Gracilibacteria bacterium]
RIFNYYFMSKYVYISGIVIGAISLGFGILNPSGCPPCIEGNGLACGTLNLCTPSPQLDSIVLGGGIIVSGISGMFLKKLKTSIGFQVTVVSTLLIVTYLIYLGTNTLVI